MKAIIRITLLFASVLIITVTGSMAQRVIKGTVYMDGKPAAGITVEAHRGETMMTSFDGLYEVEADAKTKWLKFTFIDETQKLEIADKPGDKFDHAFTGKLPSGNGEEETEDVNLQSADVLIRSQNTEFRDELSLYNEFYKQKDYKSALPHWKKVYHKFPKSTQNIYIHGIKMHQSFIDSAKSQEEKDKHIQELMNIFDKRMKYFGQRGFVQGRKGTALLKYTRESERMLDNEELKKTHKSSYEWLSESVMEMGNKTETPVLVLFMQTSKSLFRMGELPKETVVKNYETCSSIINAELADNSDDKRVKAIKEIQPIIERIFGSSGAADCEALINILTPQFEEKNNDVEFIKSMIRRLRRAKCEDSKLVEQATIQLYELEPSAEAAFNMARGYLKKDDTEKAKEYYKQAMEQETDEELLSTYYFEYAYFIYAKENALSEARSYARKALAINPGFCEASMLIGDIYVTASRSFAGTNLEKAAVYWVAVDYYNKARRGEDCSIDAAQKVSNIKKHFPNKEEAFMEGLQEGQTYKVGGWINENTKVRF